MEHRLNIPDLTPDAPNSGGVGSNFAALLPSEERRRMKRAHLTQQVAEELSFLSPWRLLTRIITLLAFIALAAFLYTGFGNNAFSTVLFPRTLFDSGIVIDAGSHGTRLHFYSWPARIHDPDHPLSGPVTFPTEVFTLSTEPGISDMALEGREPDQAGVVCIKPLLVQLMNELMTRGVSKDHWPSFPIFLKATAGMRNIDILTRARIMNSIRRYLANDTEVPFAFQWNWARVIAGEEEGVYGWLTVNNALKTILLPANQTFGAMDMGGASAQITFSPVHTSVIEGYYGVNLGGQTIRLYSHSYLGYGWGDAMARVTTRLGVETVLGSLRSQNFPLASTHQFLTHVLGPHYNSSRTPSSRPDQNPESIAATSDNIPTAPPLTSPVDSYTIPGRNDIDGDEHTSHQTTTMTTTLAPPETIGKIINVTAVHPCYPKGHKFTFTLPSLVYPDGRFYIDLDTRELVQYMRSLGIPDEYLKQILPKGRSPPSTAPPAFLLHESQNGGQQNDNDSVVPSPLMGSLDSHEGNINDVMMDEMLMDNSIMTTQSDGGMDDDAYAMPQQLFNIAPLKFPFHKTRINTMGESLNKKQKDSNSPYHQPTWLVADEDNGSSLSDFNVESSLVNELGEDTNDEAISTQAFLDLIEAQRKQAPFRRLKASKKDKKSKGQKSKRSDGGGSSSALKHPSVDGLSAASPFDTSRYPSSRDSLHGHASNGPFQPLDAPFPLEAAPRIQWVINFIGGSDFEQCQQRARDLFYNEPCFIHSCAFNGVYQPRLEESQFIAFGQFTKVQQALNVSTRATPRQLELATRDVCGKTKKQIRQAQNITGAYKPYGKKGVLNLCWKALWSHTALQWGYGFHENSTSIQFAQTVGEEPNQQAVGWASGSMIYEVNTFPWKSPLGKFEIPFLWAAITALLYFLATTFMALELRVHSRILDLAGLTTETLKVTHDSDDITPRGSGDVSPGDYTPGGYTQLS